MNPQTEETIPAFTSNLLKGKKGILFGVANKRSIAWGIAKALSDHGAQLAFAYQGERLKEGVEALAATLPLKAPLYPCDVTKDEDVRAVFEKLGQDFGSIQFLVHCIAFA